MRTFAQKPKTAQQTSSAKPATVRAHFGHSHEVNSILHLQRTIGNQAVQRMLQAPAQDGDVGLTAAASARCGHDFSRIPIHPVAAGAIQTKLAISKPGDEYEQEADRVADQIMRMPDSTVQPKCPACASGDAPCPKCRGSTRVQRKVASGSSDSSVASDLVSSLGPGQLLAPATRAFMQSRFGHDFGNVRVHTDTKAADSARAVNALAYTVGQDVVFGTGQYAPTTAAGRRLLAHELTHVVQQAGVSCPDSVQLLQRQPAGRGRTSTARSQRLEFRPSMILSPCACLAFIHNNERNARWSAEDLHRNCSYNLAIIGPGQSRTVPIRGSNRQIDPNELFPANIQEECTRDEAGCTAYEASHDDLRAMQIQFFLTIKTCTRNFALPTIVLHNNSLTDTSAFLRATSRLQRERLRGDFNRDIGEGIGSRQDLRSKLGQRGGIMDRSRTTNIFRWCNLPEISRCHIGDPDRPDNVIWVAHVDDFNRLRLQPINVVLQEGLGTTTGSESETDLSTLFLRLGPNARFINIETPITPQDQPTRDQNMAFIQQALDLIGLNCCPPVGDFPMPSRTEMIA
jgi:hypothetical protein